MKWGKDTVAMCKDITAVDPTSVVFNWECCSGFSESGFSWGKRDHMQLLSYLLHERCFMLIFSDFSLKALIHDWDVNVLGVNPFITVGSFGSKLKLCFDPVSLKACQYSSQLQILGELCDSGEADIHALGGTIAYAVDNSKVNCCHPVNCNYNWTSLDVLTIVTEMDKEKFPPKHFVGVKRELLSNIGEKLGLAGHCCLHYPGGCQILTSCPHWIELAKLHGVSVENI